MVSARAARRNCARRSTPKPAWDHTHRQPERRRRGARHRRALRPRGSPARGERRQPAAGIRHGQRRRHRQRRRRPRCRPFRPRRLAHPGRDHADGRAVRGLRGPRREQLLARHADGRPHRRADGQRHRHGKRRAQRARAAGARARQVRRIRLRHHRGHALGGGPLGGRRAGQPESGARAQHEPRRRGRVHRRRMSAPWPKSRRRARSSSPRPATAPGMRSCTPANCPGVIAVAGLRHAGTKVGLLGSRAGGRDQRARRQLRGCRARTIPAFIRSSRPPTPGPRRPCPHAAGGSIYTDAFNLLGRHELFGAAGGGNRGPDVFGATGLSPSSVRSLLQSTARAVSRRRVRDTGGAADCRNAPCPQFERRCTPVDQLQCYCTTAACGAGMLDAGAAVIAALGLQAHIAVSPESRSPGQVVTFERRAVGGQRSGRSIVAYRWEIAEWRRHRHGLHRARPMRSHCNRRRPSGAGRFTVRLTVTDNVGLDRDDVVSVDRRRRRCRRSTLNFQGMWWNAPAESESGWGINFAHQGDVIFATWFTHDAQRQGLESVDDRLPDRAQHLRRHAYPDLRAAARCGAVRSRPGAADRRWATATLTFADGNNGTFAYTVNGISQTKPITRQVFGPLPTCTWGALDEPDAGHQLHGHVVGSGRRRNRAGASISPTQGDVIFATWFTYDFTGAALPMSATLTKVGTGRLLGLADQTSGPAFTAVPFNPDAVMRTTVGTATVTFTNGNAATFSYQVNDGSKSVTQTKSIDAAGVPRAGHRVPVATPRCATQGRRALGRLRKAHVTSAARRRRFALPPRGC